MIEEKKNWYEKSKHDGCCFGRNVSRISKIFFYERFEVIFITFYARKKNLKQEQKIISLILDINFTLSSFFLTQTQLSPLFDWTPFFLKKTTVSPLLTPHLDQNFVNIMNAGLNTFPRKKYVSM